ncbi:MAG: hypothetical protein IKQ46_02245 [Bacteroidales bacterium]|nr:hypothetical protein [Bacteroidales bacterium]
MLTSIRYQYHPQYLDVNIYSLPISPTVKTEMKGIHHPHHRGNYDRDPR